MYRYWNSLPSIFTIEFDWFCVLVVAGLDVTVCFWQRTAHDKVQHAVRKDFEKRANLGASYEPRKSQARAQTNLGVMNEQG